MARRSAVRTSNVGLLVIAVGAVAFVSGESMPVGEAGSRVPPRPVADGSLSFEPNVGQAPTNVDFTARGSGYSLSLASTRAVLALGGTTVATEIVGGRTAARPSGGDPLPGRVNYLTADETTTRTDVATYGKVTYAGVYDGIDVVYYGTSGRLEYDFVVAPGADLSAIQTRFSGIDSVRLDGKGRLVMTVADGELVQEAPVTYQDVDGRRRTVASKYSATGPATFGFRVGAYDRSRPLVIDPVLAYSTYLGGSDDEFPSDVAVDAAGSAYIAASARSSNFPVTPGAPHTTVGEPFTMAVSKLSPAGDHLVYSTYLGGPGWTGADAIAVDASGSAYIAGHVDAARPVSFPTVNAFQSSYRGGALDAVVLKLNPAGTAIVYATFLGGSQDEAPTAIAVDGAGHAYVAGTTRSPDFPTANAIQSGLAGGYDGFVTKLAPTGSSLVYSTFRGGGLNDSAVGIAVDAAGNVAVGGSTMSADFPVRDALQPQRRGSQDGTVTKLDGAGALVYSTYLGGSEAPGSPFFFPEHLTDVAMDPTGAVVVTGVTTSPDFPTANPVQAALAGGQDAFVAQLSPSGSALLFSTYLGGTGNDNARAITVEGAGRASITGDTVSADFPLVNAFDATLSGQSDTFLSLFSARGSLTLSTFLGGGSADDYARGINHDTSGAVYVVGYTKSSDFPTRRPLQPSLAGGFDLYITKVARDAVVVAGQTWYIDGTTSRTGPPGTVVSAFSGGAFTDIGYRLVLASDQGCANTVAVLNSFNRYAGPSGFIPRTNGTVPLGTTPGTYWICFQDSGGSATATAAVSFTVQ